MRKLVNCLSGAGRLGLVFPQHRASGLFPGQPGDDATVARNSIRSHLFDPAPSKGLISVSVCKILHSS